MDALVTLNFWNGQKLVFKTESRFTTIESGEMGILDLKTQILSLTTDLMINWNGKITYDARIIQHKVVDNWIVGNEVRL